MFLELGIEADKAGLVGSRDTDLTDDRMTATCRDVVARNYQ